MSVWIIAGVTFREAARKKFLWMAFLAGLAFLALFGTGMHFQVKSQRNLPPIIYRQILMGMLLVGFYAVDLLAVLMTILTSVDTISGEIGSGTIQAIATKPIPRWQLLIGKWIGFAGMSAGYVAVMFAGVSAVGHFIGSIVPPHVYRGAALVFLECLLVLTITLLCGTWFATITNGAIVLGLHGLAFLGGWIEQIGALTDSQNLVTVGVVASLLMPSESVWRRAVFEMQSTFTRSVTQQIGPFSNASAPSLTMIVYAVAYLLVALSIAIYHFHERDL